ncbi:putative ATP:guanido phosphotransferase CTC_02634 [Clostridium bornimense]|uniref:Putative ATP:guanido phosphotransferase CTC_02634 n=1 Tax=Clostridium bornimense TaxID=1216932 RepID=W6S5J2_9CLOT|nr:hypothetical protein [Clostridium bornimense]CDM69617.1 putative ATP:guanido phosphotransferase CTC_02634 [Clostridium bornimense]
MINWIKNNKSNIVLSTKVSLSRNLKRYPFPHKCSDDEGKDIVEKVYNVVSEYKEEDLKLISLTDAKELDKLELISKSIVSDNVKGSSAVIINEEETVALMINEEDHIKIQCITGGFDIENPYDCCNDIDDLIEDTYDYAYESKYGYLTSSPMNLGTGMKVTVVMHLPALVMKKQIQSIEENINKIGVGINSLYLNEPESNLYEVYNKITLGLTEEEIMANLKAVVEEICSKEISCREKLREKLRYELEDKICRALGILNSAIIISFKESLKLLSYVRNGIELGTIKNIPIEKINRLLLEIEPSIIRVKYKEQLEEKTEGFIRARVIKDLLKE